LIRECGWTTVHPHIDTVPKPILWRNSKKNTRDNVLVFISKSWNTVRVKIKSAHLAVSPDIFIQTSATHKNVEGTQRYFHRDLDSDNLRKIKSKFSQVVS
jgi:hypothetical protein